jgi:pimeloyl-ACP methyl ester carboxylesterase
VLLAAVVLGVLFAPATAGAVSYAPVDRPGPALTVPQATLDASLECGAGVDHASRAPVLLLEGTGSSAHDNWSWTYEPAFDMLGIPWCALESPDHANGDVQVNGEYVVNAIRTMYARAGRKIAIVGHSQGGMVGRWALRFWPDTRGMVDDLIGFAATNHGTTQAALTCNPTCSAATWQQRDDSNFTDALNSFQESFPGISYTEVYTHTDEVVQPNSDSNGSSSIHGGGGLITNVATQEICPLDVYEHLAIGTIDPAAYALAIDALDHAGPADPSRVSLTCPPLNPLQPGVDPVTFPVNAATAAINLETSPETKIPAEPALRCYTLASCATGAAQAKKKAKCKKRKRGHKRKKACRRKKHRRH